MPWIGPSRRLKKGVNHRKAVCKLSPESSSFDPLPGLNHREGGYFLIGAFESRNMAKTNSKGSPSAMQAFPIEPGSIKGLGLISLGLFVVLGLVAALIGASVLSARTARFEVSEAGLRLRGDLYGRLVPFESIQVDQVRLVDFQQEPSLRPNLRTLGTGLPGYQGGWFRLKDGSKALLYLTDPTKAVFIPTDLGFGVLLSPQDPKGLVQALKEIKNPRPSPS